jgi:Secretion system C-terminal sorting domain/Putative carbohydrate metabolism domain
MKIFKYIILLLLIGASNVQLSSQNLPNYSFEDWDTSGWVDEPIGWGSSNFTVLSVISFKTVTEETSDPYSGNSCIKLETIEKNASGDDVKVAGLITLGTFDVSLATREAIVSGGVSMANKPSVFSGYYKYSPVGIDSCIMSIFLTRYIVAEKRRDTIGTGVFTSGAQSTWKKFEAPVSYTSSEAPDTMNIIVLSSDTSIFEPGSTLFLDDLYTDVPLGISKEIISHSFKVFPNPAESYFYIDSDIETSYDISLVNSIGNTVLHIPDYVNGNKIDLSKFHSGIYFVRTMTSNQHFFTKKLIIK